MPAHKRTSPHNFHLYDDAQPKLQEHQEEEEKRDDEEGGEENDDQINNHSSPLQSAHVQHQHQQQQPQEEPGPKLEEEEEEEAEDKGQQLHGEDEEEEDEDEEEGKEQKQLGEGTSSHTDTYELRLRFRCLPFLIYSSRLSAFVYSDSEEEATQSSSSSSQNDAELPEFVYVELLDIRKDVQCPICLGIIKKTRTVMECLHRFCRECIDKSMRLGNNECPACRTHCASRRSLRDDPNYDALIAAIYPDIDKYEEEELAFHEEERNRNKQIQASIAQIFQRQSEALVRRRTMGKEATGLLMTRPQRYNRTLHSRKRRNSRGSEFQVSEDNEDESDDIGGKDSSSTDERSTEVRQRRRKRRPGIRASQTSSSAGNPEGAENDLESSRENRGISPGLVWNAEKLAWGRGGTRSHTRHGNSNGCNSKISRNSRLSKLVEYLKGLEEKQEELDVHLMLICFDKETTPMLQQSHLCCRPSLSVKHLHEYVAHHTPLQAEQVEILLVKGDYNPDNNLTTMDEVQILQAKETLAGLKADCASSKDHLILAYRQKENIV